jgi:hypothetical protein
LANSTHPLHNQQVHVRIPRVREHVRYSQVSTGSNIVYSGNFLKDLLEVSFITFQTHFVLIKTLNSLSLTLSVSLSHSLSLSLSLSHSLSPSLSIYLSLSLSLSHSLSRNPLAPINHIDRLACRLTHAPSHFTSHISYSPLTHTPLTPFSLYLIHLPLLTLQIPGNQSRTLYGSHVPIPLRRYVCSQSRLHYCARL